MHNPVREQRSLQHVPYHRAEGKICKCAPYRSSGFKGRLSSSELIKDSFVWWKILRTLLYFIDFCIAFGVKRSTENRIFHETLAKENIAPRASELPVFN